MYIEEKLYGKTAKQMKTLFIIACVIGVIMAVVMVVVNINNMELLSLIGAGALAVVFFPFAVMGIILNFKKIFIGFFRPIPLLSYFIECFVGYGMAFKAFFWMLKNLKKNKQNLDTAAANETTTINHM